MKYKEIGEKLTFYMWHRSKILTELMLVSNSTDSPIIAQTFRAAGKLFDKLGSCIYGSTSFEEIFPKLNRFIEWLDYDANKNFFSVLE